MEGHSHALSGAAAGLAAGILLHKTLPDTAALAGFTAGGALLPDLDSCHGAASDCLGFVTRSLAWVIGRISGGHRHFCHSLCGIATLTLLAWLGVTFRHDPAGWIFLGLLVTIAASSAAEALHLTDGHLADVIGIAVAAGVVWYGYGLGLLLLATALGTFTHCCGDSITRSGIMWLYPFSQHRFHFLPGKLAFTTGTRPETLGVVPLLIVVIVLLAADALSPGLMSSGWHHAIAAIGH